MSENRPEPYLWLGYDEMLDEPIWFLPSNSDYNNPSPIWEDEDIEMQIVWWGE
jgi:hypothetical protein